MSDRGQETEAKFYVLHLDEVMARLKQLQARLIQARVLETNLRFDLPDQSFRSSGRVLRLRRDTESKLTYKGVGKNKSGVLDRQEIEFVVGDFEKAKQFLESLGYRQTMFYEKYRATYEFQNTSVMVDELPYGNFVEIEGESVEQIQRVAAELQLVWKTAIENSYTGLFENVKKTLELPFQDISFENFAGIKVTSAHLQVQPADGESPNKVRE